MDSQKPVPGSLPAEPTDLSFQVMPQEGHFDPDVPPSSPPAVPPVRSGMPPVPPSSERSAPNLMPDDSEPSFFRSKWVYIAGGLIVLIVLGLLAYFMFGTKKTAAPVAQTVTTRLPKVWLQQYFSQNLNTDGACTDLTVCGDEADSDKDGLKNFDEFKAGTSPVDPDSDADGIGDGDEVNIYKTEATLKYTDRRDVVSANDWTDGYQIKNGYDPLTPGLKFTDVRTLQISSDTIKFGLHLPTTSTLASPAPATPVNPATPVVPNNPPGAVPPKSFNVTLKNTAFSPTSLTINKGDTVIWTNKDTLMHTVTGDNGGPTSGNIAVNATYSFTFNTAGTYPYHCSIHPPMTGSIVVK